MRIKNENKEKKFNLFLWNEMKMTHSAIQPWAGEKPIINGNINI